MATIEVTDRGLGTVERPVVEPADTNTPAVKIWAGLGLAIVVFFAYIIIDWVSGPYFKKVPQGPSQPGSLMHIGLIFWQAFSIPFALGLLYQFVVKPYRRDKNVGVDGLLLLGGCTLWVQDTWSSAANHWFTYNTSMLNFGSWAHSVPWWSSYGKPGAMSSEPILFTPAAYVFIMMIAASCGCWAMRKFKARRPQTTSFQIVAFGFLAMCIFDVVLEGIIWLPMGVYEYPGGHWAIFAHTYHPYPLNETLTIGSVFTALAALKYFRDDRGHTVVERGITKLNYSPGKSLVYRALAVAAFMNVAMFLGYNVPNTMIGANSHAWPKEVQERSYFTDFLCGDGTDRACPGPGNPNITQGSAYPNTNGGVTGKLPGIVPFDKGKPGGAN